MTIEIPDEIISSKLTATQKLIVGIVLTYPNATRFEVAEKLGVTVRSVFKALKEAKSAYEPLFTKHEPAFTKGEPAFTPLVVSSSIKEEAPKFLPTQPPTQSVSPPTKEEVAAYAATKGRADLADEFFTRCEEDQWLTGKGEPITKWKRWFDGWASRKAKPAAPRKPKLTAEQARMQADMAGY